MRGNAFLYSGKLAGAAQAGMAAANVLEKSLGQFQQTLLEIEDALAALLRLHRLDEYDEVQSGFVGAGYLTSCIVLLPDWARELRRAVQTLGFGCRLGSINAPRR